MDGGLAEAVDGATSVVAGAFVLAGVGFAASAALGEAAEEILMGFARATATLLDRTQMDDGMGSPDDGLAILVLACVWAAISSPALAGAAWLGGASNPWGYAAGTAWAVAAMVPALNPSIHARIGVPIALLGACGAATAAALWAWAWMAWDGGNAVAAGQAGVAATSWTAFETLSWAILLKAESSESESVGKAIGEGRDVEACLSRREGMVESEGEALWPGKAIGSDSILGTASRMTAGRRIEILAFLARGLTVRRGGWIAIPPPSSGHEGMRQAKARAKIARRLGWGG